MTLISLTLTDTIETLINAWLDAPTSYVAFTVTYPDGTVHKFQIDWVDGYRGGAR